MKKKSLNIHKRDNQSFRHRLLLSIFRIAAPVTAIVCTVSIVMLTLNYRQTVINSQAAATEKVRSDIAHIVDNTQILSQDIDLQQRNPADSCQPVPPASSFHKIRTLPTTLTVLSPTGIISTV